MLLQFCFRENPLNCRGSLKRISGNPFDFSDTGSCDKDNSLEMKSGLPAVLLVAFFLFAKQAASQTNSEDSIFHQTAVSHSIAVYFKQIGDQSPLYNGSLYAEYPYPFKEGTPFFPLDNFSSGSVVYDGIRFDSVALLYDNLRQLVVLKKDAYLLQLVNQRVTAFEIADHHFVRLEAGNSNPGIPVTGFYEVLYPGRSEVLKVTIQNIQDVASITEGMIHFIESSNAYYVKSGSTFIRVKTRGELIDVFQGHEKEIQKFIKKNKLNFRRDKENTFIQAAGYYDQIAK